MHNSLILLIVIIACAILSTAVFAAGKRPLDAWVYYHFDGTAFTSGPAVDGSGMIAIKEKARPVLLTTPAAQIEHIALPDGEGAIAGICYIQSTGGKLGGGGSFLPHQHVPLLISSGGKPFVTVQTDDQGYFVVVLPAGVYSLGSGPATAEITVERGITTLAPLRTGKRMVD